MKRFSFSLEKVLRYKRLLKEEKQTALLKANLVYLEQKRELERLQLLLEEHRNNLLSGKLTPAILVHRMSSIELLSSRVATQENKTETAQKHVRECRQRLIEADQEQQVLEKLKQRKRQEYLHNVELELQKELDEVAASAYFRRG